MSRYDWALSHAGLEGLRGRIAADRDRVIAHPVYSDLTSLSAVRTFMEHHVYAVWDFMSLLKSLQRSFTGIRLPWMPVGDRTTRRLINEIVMVEESDEYGEGFISHFELYLDGLVKAGADTTAVTAFLSTIERGAALEHAARACPVPGPSRAFLETTWDIVRNSPIHCQAAAFAFGREDLIPDMFEQVVSIDDQGGCLSTFIDYLSRHIEVDGEVHTPMAMHMLVQLCGDDDVLWRECEEVVQRVFAARMALWDGIHAAIVSPQVASVAS